MNTIKNIVIACAFYALASFAASAQSYNLQATAMNGGTNNIAAASTNSYTGPVVVATKSNNLGLQAALKLDGAGTTAIVFVFDSSLDGSTWADATHTLSITPAGTAVKSTVSTTAAGGIGYFRLSAIRNANASNATNIVLKYSTKNGL